MDELIRFFEKENLDSSLICEILNIGLNIFPDERKPPETLIQEFREYWERWKHTNERPLFY